MAYAQMLREMFPESTLDPEDLLLLDTFQIKYLPERVAKREFSTLLWEYPVVKRFLISKYPPISPFIKNLLAEQAPPTGKDQINVQCQEALWEIADLIIYNKNPEIYDRNTEIHWDISEISSITPLEGFTVADVGAGSGRIAFLVAPFAQTVFAVEPLASFRSFMKEKAVIQRVNNLFVMDGTLDSIPLPDNSLDILITSNAIGWNLDQELKEIERVVKPEGHAIHMFHADSGHEDPYREILTSSPWDYQFTQDQTDKTMKIRYYKRMPLE
jgi:hypothetical protein